MNYKYSKNNSFVHINKYWYIICTKYTMSSAHIHRSAKELNEIIEGTILLNYKNPNFCVGKLSSLLKICESHLRDIITKNYNMSPKHLVESIRLEKSLEYLSSGQRISETIRNCGYSDSRTFRNAFKKRFHLSPSEFRKLTKTEYENKKKIIDHYLCLLWLK